MPPIVDAYPICGKGGLVRSHEDPPIYRQARRKARRSGAQLCVMIVCDKPLDAGRGIPPVLVPN